MLYRVCCRRAYARAGGPGSSTSCLTSSKGGLALAVRLAADHEDEKMIYSDQ
jgi:hypothetical protein